MFGINAWIHAIPCVSRVLDLRDLAPDPYLQFDRWMRYAKRASLPEPNAMALCSVDEHGRPSQRMVLLKHISAERGLVFYTNYGSRKARELDAHSAASVLFHQHILQRQIRVTGRVERASPEESEAYFRSRLRGSQLGAWASRQSETLADRDTFERRYAEIEQRFAGQDVPCPPFWGGYRLVPDSFEFWQGRAHRLHDRFVYQPDGQGGWRIQRLYP
jgi:pyridoxamine 5'-phosphate oxidase